MGSYDSLDKLFSVLNINNDFNYDSPFFPGIPTDPNGFKGRIDTLNHILRYFSNVFKGRTQHFYLTGKRRMGKTSIIMFLKDYMNSSILLELIQKINSKLELILMIKGLFIIPKSI